MKFIPGVSKSVILLSLIDILQSITCLVVWGLEVSAAIWLPDIKLNNDDLPTLGFPIIEIIKLLSIKILSKVAQ